MLSIYHRVYMILWFVVMFKAETLIIRLYDVLLCIIIVLTYASVFGVKLLVFLLEGGIMAYVILVRV